MNYGSFIESETVFFEDENTTVWFPRGTKRKKC